MGIIMPCSLCLGTLASLDPQLYQTSKSVGGLGHPVSHCVIMSHSPQCGAGHMVSTVMHGGLCGGPWGVGVGHTGWLVSRSCHCNF